MMIIIILFRLFLVDYFLIIEMRMAFLALKEINLEDRTLNANHFHLTEEMRWYMWSQ